MLNQCYVRLCTARVGGGGGGGDRDLKRCKGTEMADWLLKPAEGGEEGGGGEQGLL